MQLDKFKGILSHKHKSTDVSSVTVPSGEVLTIPIMAEKTAAAFSLATSVQNGVYNSKNGFLYNYYAISTDHIAADGWHVPFEAEWNTLFDFLGGAAVAGWKLQSSGTILWNLAKGTNTNGFNAPGSGRRNGFGDAGGIGAFGFLKDIAYWWCADSILGNPSVLAKTVGTVQVSQNIQRGSVHKTGGYPIRLVKNMTALTNGQTGIYIGNNGRSYKTICIGTQEWLSENLCETIGKYGDSISEITDPAVWVNMTTQGRCSYGNSVDIALDNKIDTVLNSITEVELSFNFLSVTPIIYNVPKAMKLTSQMSESTAATLSIALGTNMAQFAKLTITPTAIGLVVLKGVLL